MRLFRFSLLTLFLVILSFIVILEQDVLAEPAEQVCQQYRVRADALQPVPIRNCPNDNCDSIDTLSLTDSICVLGLSQDSSLWAVVDPQAAGTPGGFVARTLIEPGDPANRVAESNRDYCLGYTPVSGEVVVRSDASVSSPALGGLVDGDVVCVRRWDYEYTFWLGIDNGNGWVPSSSVEIVREWMGEEFEDCEAYEIKEPQSNIYSCASYECNVVNTLPQGTRFCVDLEAEEDVEWLAFDYGDPTSIGFAQLGLLEPVSPEVEAIINGFGEEAGIPNTPTPTVTPIPIAQTIANVNLRESPSLNAPVLSVVNEGVQLLILSIDATGWYNVQMRSGLTGWVSPNSVTVSGLNESIPGFAAANLPEATKAPEVASVSTSTTTPTPAEIVQVVTAPPLTPTPLLTTIPADATTGQAQAATLTPTPGVCLEGQTENCVTPTPSGLSIFAPPAVELNEVLLAQDIPFEQLRLQNLRLESPQGSARYNLFLPSDWEMAGQSILYLTFSYTESVNPDNERARVDLPALSSTLEISLDGNLISVLTLSQSNAGQTQTIEVPLPTETLNNDQFHRIDLIFRAQDHCEASVLAAVDTDAARSYIHFEYFEEKPLLDLAQYPRPFFNSRLSTEQESVVLVLPSSPTETEVQAAASIASGLGFLSSNAINIRLRTVNELSAFERDNSDLILIGSPARNTLISDYYAAGLLPTELLEDNIRVGESVIEPDHGVIQLVRNPASDNLAVMVVTSLTDDGLRKAGNSLAGPPAILGVGGPVIIITETRDIVRGEFSSIGRDLVTFQDLGQAEDIILQGIGQSRQDLEFFIPPGVELTEDAYVELEFNNSALLENPSSSFSILINESPIETVILDDLNNGQNSAIDSGIQRLRAPITPGLVNPGGNNVLSFVLSAGIPAFECVTPDSDVIWFTISNGSEIYLPRDVSPPRVDENFVGRFPAQFLGLPNLSDLWINLPDEPTNDEIQQAIQLVAQISSSILNGEGISPRVNIGDLPPGVDVSQYNFIVIGRPTTSGFVSALNTIERNTGNRVNATRPLLPQPFVPGTDNARQVLDDVEYQLPPGFEVGILQMFDSPWNADRKILLVSGTGAKGQRDAMQQLLANFTPSDLAGDVVFVTGDFISYIDSTRVYESIEVLEASLFLPGDASLIAQQATQDAQATQTTSTPVSTVTPLPSPTATPTVLLADVTLTPLITSTPEPTPFPTFEPIPVDALTPPPPEPPQQLIYLVYVTIGSMVIVGLVAVIRLIVGARRRNQ